MAVITIDGTRLEVPENKNVLECALEAGIYIPHLCHHPDLPENGSCRMCIVEVEGQEGVTTSCTLRAQDGMVVHTTSERINKLRTLALELLLAGHPEDCSTCPKYGNCELQTLIQYIGANNARMRTRIKGIKMEEGNPLLIHDMNRCGADPQVQGGWPLPGGVPHAGGLAHRTAVRRCVRACKII